MPASSTVFIDPDVFDGVIFDMDGVITDTAGLHAEAWKKLFDDVLKQHAWRTGERFVSFDPVDDYLKYVDGMSRADGVRTFLASRGIEVPEGSPDDPPDAETVHGLGSKKNDFFLTALEEHGAVAFPEAVRLLHELRAAGVATAIISASRNAGHVLDSAGVTELFDAQVDGTVADDLGLAGKPDPAVFLEAARRLGIDPARAVVVEDAEAGVAAGASGGFALVIGVDHTGAPERLLANGAHVVVHDMAEVAVGAGEDAAAARPAAAAPAAPPAAPPADPATAVPMAELPSALEEWAAIEAHIAGRTLAVFLDYDGTLTPIVEHPEDALLDEGMRERIRDLASRCLVSVVSGRDVAFVIEQVAVDEVIYLGSHGFDVVTPEGVELSNAREGEFDRFLGPLNEAEHAITDAVAPVLGARIERKKYAIAVHYRQVAPVDAPIVERAVDEVLANQPLLRKTGGKKVFELRPDIDWDKGRALQWLLEALGKSGSDVVPVYIGDDLTDEDAFAVVRGRGLAIVVAGEDERASLAEYRVADTDEVGEVLGWLAGLAGGAA